MIKVEGVRGAGKTTTLIEMADKKGYVIVEPSVTARDAIQRKAEAGGKHVMVMSPSEFLSPSWSRERKFFLIDELDFFLESLGVIGYSNTIKPLSTNCDTK